MKEAFFRAIQKQVLLYTSEFSIEDPTNVFWLVVYGIVTLLLKKLMILAFWVIEINVKDLEVCITEGTDEPIQHSLSLRIDSFSFHRFQDVSDSWKQLTVSSLSVSYASSLIQSPFLLAHFQNALSLRVHISCQSRVDRIKCTLPKQSSNHPHSISLLHSPRAFSIEFRLFPSPSSPIPSFSHSPIFRVPRLDLPRSLLSSLPPSAIGTIPILVAIHAIFSLVPRRRLPRSGRFVLQLLSAAPPSPRRPSNRHHRWSIAFREHRDLRELVALRFLHRTASL